MITTKPQIDLFHLTVLVSALRLETLGMKHSSGTSAYSVLKNNYGLKGSREFVLKQAQEMLKQIKGEVIKNAN